MRERITPEHLGDFDCDKCGKPYKLLQMACLGGENKGQPVTWKHGCLCANRQLAQEALEAEERLRISFVHRHFVEHSHVNEALKKCTFENYYPGTDRQKHGLDICQRLATNFKPKLSFNMALYGGYGVGKSHLAYSVCRAILRKGFSSIFVTMPHLCTEMRDVYHREDGIEGDIYKRLCGVDLLVIDELGTERKGEWTDDILYKLIEGRAGKVTLYTSNFDRDQLQKRMTPRNFSKFSLDMHYLYLDGNDYRQRRAGIL